MNLPYSWIFYKSLSISIFYKNNLDNVFIYFSKFYSTPNKFYFKYIATYAFHFFPSPAPKLNFHPFHMHLPEIPSVSPKATK